MDSEQARGAAALAERIGTHLGEGDLGAVAALLAAARGGQLRPALERLSSHRRAVAYRLLPKERALRVFEDLDPGLQSDLVQALQDAEVAALFADLEPDDRVWLLDELPAALAPRLLRGLPERERQLTATVLGYPQDAVGRRMSPEYVRLHADDTVARALERVHARLDEAETVYTLPVTDGARRLVGVVGLRELLGAAPQERVAAVMEDAHSARATEDAEVAGRRCADHGLLALPIVDSEDRLVGLLTIDDAVHILEREESEDAARLGGSEPLHRPYLATPIATIVRSRVVWLAVLALGATLTVQVLSHFEATLERATVLALFIPLLIGTGGNTGNQAATTVTRALALGDVGPGDALRVLGRELRAGLALGTLLGGAGLALAGATQGMRIGLVVGLALLGICTMAAAVGGVMPLLARAVRADPAVFSNPFISTFVDAAGLVVFFLIARAVLGL